MRKMLAIGAVVAALLTAGTAWAADLRAPVYKAPSPVVPQAYNWTGFYIGAHAGYTWLKSTETISPANASALTFFGTPPDVATSLALDPRGFIGGGQFGYNWQFDRMWVVGLEADFSGTAARSTVSAPGPNDPTRIMTGNEKLDWFGTVRGRIGVTPFDRALLYATGGLAYGQASLSTALTRTIGCGGNNCQSGSVSDVRAGWTVGGGIEWAFVGNWSLKGEYLYYDLGTISHSMTDPAFPAIFNASAPVRGSIARGGLNYKFDWGGPVVARY